MKTLHEALDTIICMIPEGIYKYSYGTISSSGTACPVLPTSNYSIDPEWAGDFGSEPEPAKPGLTCPPVLKNWFDTTKAFLKANPPPLD